MTPILIIATQEHNCRKCGKKIHVGEKTVKTVSSPSSCSVTEIYSVYVHEGCWRAKGRTG